MVGAPDALAGETVEPPAAVPPRGYPGEMPDRRLAPDAPPFAPPLISPAADGDGDSWDAALAERAGQWHAPAAAEEPATPQNGHSGGNGSLADRLPASNVVGQFVAERCETGEDSRMLAGELYAGFLGWCQDSGRQPVSQRAFGMRLTGLGLKRKRRGHGKHWWEGIRLASS